MSDLTKSFDWSGDVADGLDKLGAQAAQATADLADLVEHVEGFGPETPEVDKATDFTRQAGFVRDQASTVKDKAQRLAKALRATAGVLAVLALAACSPEARFERAVERWEDRAAEMTDGDEKSRARAAAYKAAAAKTGYVR